MAEAKIEIKIGELHFSAEAEQQWVASQLDKIIAKADVLGKLAEKHELPAGSGGGGPAKLGSVPALGSYLGSKNATTNQVRKFLSTAGWLHLKGKTKMGTADITKALKDNHQSRLGNPADCLNQNVKKGFCEKDDSDFFITTEGLKELGI
jgi:hypothetical protein